MLALYRRIKMKATGGTPSRMLKKSSSFVLASLRRHGALTVSRPCANVRRLLRRLAHLNVRPGKRARLGGLGAGPGEKGLRFASEHCLLTDSPACTNMALFIHRAVHLAAASLDGLFEHPHGFSFSHPKTIEQSASTTFSIVFDNLLDRRIVYARVCSKCA